MTRYFLALLFAATTFAQSASLSVTSSTPVAPPVGTSVTLTLSLVNGGGPAGLQFDYAGLPTPVPATTLTSKTMTCAAARCLIFGLNSTAIPDGPVATIQYTQPAANPTLTTSNTFAASPTGSAIALTPAPPFTIPVQSKCDLNGDGKVDATDLGLITQQALSAPVGGSPGIVDVVKIFLASQPGGACTR